SSVLQALARRMPSIAHRLQDSTTEDVALDAIAVGDNVVGFPHETCPLDGRVTGGHGVMDESYLTGEPYAMPKAPGSEVFSGAVNGERSMVWRASVAAVDSRSARIMNVMRDSEQRRPQLRRLGDVLGARYTPVALLLAAGARGWSGSPPPLP